MPYTYYNLTPRQRQLTDLLIEGFSMAQIADKMSIKVGTVRKYKENVFIRLDVRNSIQLYKKVQKDKRDFGELEE